MNIHELRFWYRVGRSKLKSAFFSFLFKGVRPDLCCICGESSLFLDAVFGEYYRSRVICPHCGSWDRHRFAYEFYLKQQWNGGRTFHFDSEKCLIPRLSTFIRRYSFDDAHKFNIENLYSFRNETYQNVIMHAVLEAVDNLPKAIHELHRILKPGGHVYTTCGVLHNQKTVNRELSTGSRRDFGSLDIHEVVRPFKVEKMVDFGYPTRMVVLRKD